MVTRIAPVRVLVYPRTGAKVYLGDAREVLAGLLDHSVDCRVTSPAYWDLRDYHLPPVFWGFDPDRDHRWARRGHDGSGASALDRPSKLPMVAPRGSAADDVGSFCLLCDAWLGSLGLEPTPPLYVEHLVDVSRS